MSARKTQIIVLTDVEDAHIPYVQRHLKDPMIIIDPRALLAGKKLTYTVENGVMTPLYEGQLLSQVKSVWFRKPRSITPDVVPVAESFKAYTVDALRSHYASLLSCFKEALWVSDYYNLWRASDKPWQLAVAQRLGFKVPDTVVTSDSDVARAFISAHETCIMKPAVPFVVEIGNVKKNLYSTLVSGTKMPELEGLYLSPAIFQENIDYAYEVRVSVVGNRSFAAIVRHTDTKQTPYVRDWRIGYSEGGLNFEAFDNFPKEISDKCIRHVQEMGLNFGAIDLIVDKKGVFWFLENNPNGQWGFIERTTGLQIGKALAELLEIGSE